jgi:Family of unknown function (DUF6510)
MDAAVDGNAVAGVLAEIFVVDMTVARTTCATCGDTRPMAELRAYVRSAGTVLRCASCGAVLVRLVRSPDRAWLDLRGLKVVELDLHDGGGR